MQLRPKRQPWVREHVISKLMRSKRRWLLFPTAVSWCVPGYCLFAIADGWQDALRRELEGTTIHFIDKDWSKPHAVLVDLHQLPAKHRDAKVKARYYKELFQQ